MPPRATTLSLPGPLLLEPEPYTDARGFFLETFNRAAWAQAGVTCDFVQDNHSRSQQHTLRGMHFQRGEGQAKLVRVARGEIHDVVVDLRADSPQRGRWAAVTLDDVRHQQLFVPAGFAHGFCVLSAVADVIYKVSRAYDPALEAGFAWNDPDVGITWPIGEPVLSERDRNAPRWRDLFGSPRP